MFRAGPVRQLVYERRVAGGEGIVSDMSERVRATWYDVVRAQGVSERDAETIRGAFLYEGFCAKAAGREKARTAACLLRMVR